MSWEKEAQFIHFISDKFDGVSEETEFVKPRPMTVFGNLRCGAVLSNVAVDKAGRFWREDHDKLVMFFDPRAKA